MAYFAADDKWFSGVVVRHNGGASYAVLYDEDNEHEMWEFPDDEIVFRCVAAGSHCVEVTRAMLPSL